MFSKLGSSCIKSPTKIFGILGMSCDDKNIGDTASASLGYNWYISSTIYLKFLQFPQRTYLPIALPKR